MAKNITPTWRLCLTSGGFSRSVSAAWRRPGGSPDAEPISIAAMKKDMETLWKKKKNHEKTWENHGKKNMKNNEKPTIVHGQNHG